MTPDEIRSALSDEQVVALTACFEAQSRFENGRWIANPIEAMADIINVVHNRAAAKLITPKEVCLAHAQFSCWAPLQGSNNYAALMAIAWRLLNGVQPLGVMAKCVALSSGAPVDTLDGATHYYAPASMIPVDRVPAWAADARFVLARYGHRFYANVAW